MARKETIKETQTRLQRSRYSIEQARRKLTGTPLGPLLSLVRMEECADTDRDPQVGAVDPVNGVLLVNPHHVTHGRHPLSQDEWTYVLAHLLLHLGLNHAARREERDPLVWNAACDRAADRMLRFLRIGRPYRDAYWEDDRNEEAIYDELMLRRQGDLYTREDLLTMTGRNRPDIIGIGRFQPYRYDYEEKLGEGIRRAVQEAVAAAAETLTDALDRRAVWPPIERAKSWVMSEFPLLGALASEVRVYADAGLCDRMDVSIAAVSGFLGEMYFHPDCNFTHDEIVFVYVHELLHVALLHHTRTAGRDPYVWNLACDFVINQWLIEMGVGKMPRIGGLYDPRLQGMSAEQIYDLLIREPKTFKGLRGFRGKLGDVLLDRDGRRIYRDDVATLDDVYRRCLAAGLACHGLGPGRGFVPAGLLEEIKSLFTPPVPWDVELARWMDRYVPLLRDWRRTYARASRRQSSTPDIPRPARYLPHEVLEACTFGVVLDTSGSMYRQLLGRALGAIASYAEARDVPAVRLVQCDAVPYDRGFVTPTELRGQVAVVGRGGTILQPAIAHLISRQDFPPTAPVMVLTDGWCEEEIVCPREHCFVLPRKSWREGALPLRTSAPVFRVLREQPFEN
jgi:predicted metal-dependent peptidase